MQMESSFVHLNAESIMTFKIDIIWVRLIILNFVYYR
jgi:hypothetical protein